MKLLSNKLMNDLVTIEINTILTTGTNQADIIHDLTFNKILSYLENQTTNFINSFEMELPNIFDITANAKLDYFNGILDVFKTEEDIPEDLKFL